MAQRAGYSRISIYTLLFLFKVRLVYLPTLWRNPGQRLQTETPKIVVSRFCCPGVFSPEKTEESIHITYIEVAEDVEAKEAG